MSLTLDETLLVHVAGLECVCFVPGTAQVLGSYVSELSSVWLIRSVVIIGSNTSTTNLEHGGKISSHYGIYKLTLALD
jgi:hypothetical protein